MYNPIKLVRRIYEYLLNIRSLKKGDIEVGAGWKISGKLYLQNSGRIRIGDRLRINSSMESNPVGGWGQTMICVSRGAILNLGNQVGISNSALYCSNRIDIEDNVLIGGGCRIYDTDFHGIRLEDRVQHENDPGIATSPVHISKGAFIGAGAIILKGVSIGEQSIVGAGSVVTRNIPAFEIWGGNPARKLRDLPAGPGKSAAQD